MAKSRENADGQELIASVNALRDEVRVLRESIDEFRTDFVHLLRNLPDNPPPPYQLLTTLVSVVDAVDAPSPTASQRPGMTIPSVTSDKPSRVRRRSLFDDLDK